MACSDAGGPASSVMTALVEEVPFTAENPPDDYVATYDSTTGTMDIFGRQSPSSTIFDNLGLDIPHFHGPGRYLTCGPTSDSLVVFPYDSANAFYFQVNTKDTLPLNGYETEGGCGSGEIDVQSYDRAEGTIAGGFDVVLIGSILGDTLHVTVGQFHGRISTFPPPPYPDTIPAGPAQHR